MERTRMNELAAEFAAHFTEANQKAQRWDDIQRSLDEVCDGLFRLVSVLSDAQVTKLEEAIRIRRGDLSGGDGS